MGWRFVWHFIIERDDPPPGEYQRYPRLLFFAIVGLAAIGIVTVWWVRNH